MATECVSFLWNSVSKVYFIPYYSGCFILFTVVFYICYFYITTSRKVARWTESRTPFLQPVPLIGCKKFLNLREQNICAVYDQIYRENADKDLVALYIFTTPTVMLRNPKLFKNVYAKSWDKTFCNGFRPPTTDVEIQSVGFLGSDKALWKKGRNTMGPFFTTPRLGGTTFSKIKVQIERLWHYSEEARLKGRAIDVKEFASNFIGDSIISWGFSEHTNAYEKKEVLHEIVQNFFTNTPSRLAALFVQVNYPALQFFKSFRFVPTKYVDFMATFLRRKMVNRRDGAKEAQNDLIDYFMSLDEKQDEDPEGGQKDISLRHMTGYSLALLLAGSDTTSHLSLFCIHLLSTHSEYQDRIKAEIDDVMHKHNVSELTFEVVQDLPLTEQCVMETSRLYPFFVSIPRVCSEEFQVPGTPYSLRKGETLNIIPYSIQRDPKYFKDPEKFFPERFSPENRHFITPDAFVNFGCGPRKCPGYKVGIFLAVIFTASLVSKYKIKPRSHLYQMTADDFDPKGAFTLPKGQLLVDLIPR